MAHDGKGDQWGYVAGYEMWNKQRSGKSNRRAETSKITSGKSKKVRIWSAAGVIIGVLLVLTLLVTNY